MVNVNVGDRSGHRQPWCQVRCLGCEGGRPFDACGWSGKDLGTEKTGSSGPSKAAGSKRIEEKKPSSIIADPSLIPRGEKKTN